MPIHLDSDFIFILLCVGISILVLVLTWVHKTINYLTVRCDAIEQKSITINQELQQTKLQGKSYTDLVVTERMQPIEQALADVRGFTQTIDINIRLLIDKIDLAVKHNEQQ